jgi:transcription elongation factor GreA
MADDNTKNNEELTEEDLALAGQSRSGSGASDDDTDEDVMDSDGDDEESSRGEVEEDIVSEGFERETLVTKEGLAALKDELLQLETVKRKEVAARLKESISFGDLSENSEYEDAKNEQALVESRINELQRMIKTAKIITEKKSSGKIVKLGSTVKLQNISDKDYPEEYTIVGSTEANPLEKKISNESPIGVAIIDK